MPLMPKVRPPQPAPAREFPPTVLAAIVLLALLAALLLSARWAVSIVNHVEEFGQAMDSFGYLQSAADLRAGKSPIGTEPFTADSPRARELIAHFQEQNVPVEKWSSAVAPSAYHYMPTSGKIVNQYPPGVGRLLALFPPGGALRTLYWITFGFLGAAAVALAAWAWGAVRRHETLVPMAAAAVGFLALHAAVNVLATTVSYSIDFFILGAVPAVGLAVFSGRPPHHRVWMGLVFAGVAGLAAGYLVQVRVAAASLLPGLGALVWVSHHRRRGARLGVWGVAVMAAGVVPMMVHNARLTGSAFVSTYVGQDAAGPSLGVVPLTVAHYFAGDGSLLNWVLYVAVAVTPMTVVAVRRGCGPLPQHEPGWRWWAALGVLFAVPTGYFLLHPVATAYYQFPTVECVVLGLGCVLMTMPARTVAPGGGAWDRLVLGGVVLGAAVPLAVALIAPRQLFEGPAPPPRGLEVPAEVDRASFVFAERYSGTLWWSHGIYAMNLGGAEVEVQREAMRFLRGQARGVAAERVYVVDDRPMAAVKAEVHPLLREAQGMGATCRVIGSFEGAKVWQVEWGAGSP
jgi:hypothetical protein